MGTIYYVVCEDCKVIRELDKFYTMFGGPKDREEALAFKKNIKDDAFRAGLLVGFMGEHQGHTCRIVNDVMDLDNFVFGTYEDYRKESKQFWGAQ